MFTIHKNPRIIAYSAIIAALYVVLTITPGLNAISYGPVQFRLAEALMPLSMFTPAGIFGTTIGCLLSNLFSPFGANMLDLIFGTLATLLAGIATYWGRNFFKNYKWFSPLPTVLFNALIVGTYLPWIMIAFDASITAVTLPLILSCIGSVGIGEIAVCYVLGVPLAMMVEKRGLLR